MKAIAKHVRISSKKANLVAGLIRNKPVVEALDILKFTPKKGAAILYKVVASAVANAENNFKQSREALEVKEIVVTQGPTLKRSIPISKGRMHPRLKRTAHITVTVAATGDAKAKKPAKKAETKDTKAKVEEPKAEKTTKQSKSN